MAGLIDKIIIGINNGTNSITEGSKNVVEKAKINTAIRTAEEDKKKLAELLGMRAYGLYLSGTVLPEELHNFCLEIKKRDDEVEKQTKSLSELEAGSVAVTSEGRVCECGFENNPDAFFCAQCGKGLERYKNVL